MRHYLIVANGNFLAKEIICEAAENKIIIALDGSSNRLMRMQIMPQIIIGDLDSIDLIDPNLIQNRNDLTILLRDDQNLTDLTKAIHYCDEQHAASITIVCAIGARMDHHEGAMRALRKSYSEQRPMLLHTEMQTIRYAKNETVVMHGEIGDKCGILAYPHGYFSSQGLGYDVTDFELSFGYSESIANFLAKPEARVDIKGEALLIMPAMLKSQREFMYKSENEKLQIYLRDLQQA